MEPYSSHLVHTNLQSCLTRHNIVISFWRRSRRVVRQVQPIGRALHVKYIMPSNVYAHTIVVQTGEASV